MLGDAVVAHRDVLADNAVAQILSLRMVSSELLENQVLDRRLVDGRQVIFLIEAGHAVSQESAVLDPRFPHRLLVPLSFFRITNRLELLFLLSVDPRYVISGKDQGRQVILGGFLVELLGSSLELALRHLLVSQLLKSVAQQFLDLHVRLEALRQKLHAPGEGVPELARKDRRLL